jgi:hypothetical protein
MGVERFAKRIAEQPRKANKPVMPSPCGASWDCAILTGSIDQQKFHKAIYRFCTMASARWTASAWPGQLTGIKALEHDPEKWVPVFRKDHAQTKR